MTKRPTVLIAQPLLTPLFDLLSSGYDAAPLWEAEGQARLATAEILITAGEHRLDRQLLDQMTSLRLIACFTVGYDGVDLEWASAHGVAVTHAVGANADDVADHAIGLIVAHRRHILDGDRILRAGEWTAETKIRTRSLKGARIGIVGMGSIGLATARRAEAMNMAISWWSPRNKPGLPWPRAESLQSLAAQSDILVVAAKATDDNRGLISVSILDALGSDGLLVNVARGQLVDEDALIDALREGRLGGAALDVFVTEPTPAERWADVPNCVLTPHMGGATDESVAAMVKMLFANLAAHTAGQPLPNRVV